MEKERRVARNIEIKARASDFDTQRKRAEGLADAPPIFLTQTDTFFHASDGRLKLREFGDGSAELIHYRRTDSAGPKPSDYVRAPAADPASLKAALTRALGVRATISKTREVFMAGQTRIHFDAVEWLGRFIELEVVLEPDQPERDGETMARELMARLGIAESDLLTGAYVDLIQSL